MKLFTKKTISDDGRIKVEKVTTSIPFPIHKHDFLELVYIIAGGGIQIIDGLEYPVCHGSLLFIDYGQTHSLIPKNSMTYVHILLEPEFFSRELLNAESIVDIFCSSLFSEFSGKQDSVTQCVTFNQAELMKIDYLIGIILHEYELKEQGYLTILRASIQTLFAWLLRKMHSGNTKIIPASMQDVIDYINEHFTEKIELNQIAAKGFYNPDYLSRLLKKYCGKSFSQYVKEKRITQAANLLKTTGLSVNDIMLQSGYTDSKMFYQHFKEIYGTSPGCFRQKR